MGPVEGHTDGGTRIPPTSLADPAPQIPQVPGSSWAAGAGEVGVGIRRGGLGSIGTGGGVGAWGGMWATPTGEVGMG